MAGWKSFSTTVGLNRILADRFRIYLILALFLLGLGIYAREEDLAGTPELAQKEIVFFFNPLCPHCQKQKEFNPTLQAKFPQLRWTEYDVSRPENNKHFAEFIEKSGRQLRQVVPTTFIGPYVIVGFKDAATTGVKLERAILAYLKDDPALFDSRESGAGDPALVVPILGEIDYRDYSLFTLAMVLGLVDGFNPCAMWVLVYLISLILTLKEKRKIWLLAGTFVAASGLLYFLFMTAWLNAFLLLGYLRIVTLGVGLVALGAGLLNIREYLRSRGELVCPVGDPDAKKATMGRIEKIVAAPLTLFTIVNIVALAFIVNSIEFACSAALPAIFTHTLALSQLPPLHYYGYILLYDLFFMLDDLVIFTLAILALNTTLGQRYVGYCKIIGGIVLLILGGIMVFHPGLLR